MRRISAQVSMIGLYDSSRLVSWPSTRNIDKAMLNVNLTHLFLQLTTIRLSRGCSINRMTMIAQLTNLQMHRFYHFEQRNPRGVSIGFSHRRGKGQRLNSSSYL